MQREPDDVRFGAGGERAEEPVRLAWVSCG